MFENRASWRIKVDVNLRMLNITHNQKQINYKQYLIINHCLLIIYNIQVQDSINMWILGKSSFKITLIAYLTLFCTFTRCQDDADEQFGKFAEHLADFYPTQSFQFDLFATQQQTLMFWPPVQAEYIRGLFYITSPENGGLFVGCESGNEMKKTFYNKKIGVFNFKYSGTGDMKIILKSQIHKLTVYIAYQIFMRKPPQKIQIKKNETEEQRYFGEVGQKFEKVQRTIVGQRAILDGIVKSQLADQKNIQNQMNSKLFKVLFETIVVIGSGFLSLWMLKNQLRNGYELII